MATTWEQIRSEVRSFRASVQPTVTTIRDFCIDSKRDRVYFLANDFAKSSKSPMLFRVDLPPMFKESDIMDFDMDVTFSSATATTASDSDSDNELDRGTDQGLVPFSPDSYQFFASLPSLPVPTRRPRTMSAVDSDNAHNQQQAHHSSHPSLHYRHHPPSHHHQHQHQLQPPITHSLGMEDLLAGAPVLEWIPVLSNEWIKQNNSAFILPRTDATKEVRKFSSGVNQYQFEARTNTLMFPYGAAIYLGRVQEDGQCDPTSVQPEEAPQSVSSPTERSVYASLVHSALATNLNFVSIASPLSSPKSPSKASTSSGSNSTSSMDGFTPAAGARSDPQLGGLRLDLIAFTRDQDIWVMNPEGIETQLTFCSKNKGSSPISCGIAEFIMQEEFHRFTNYYWYPTPQAAHSINSDPRFVTDLTTIESTVTKNVERILYLQVSENMVDMVVIPRQGMHPDVEEYRYPHAGTPNAASDLQIVEFVPRTLSQDIVPEPVHKRLWGNVSLYKLFPWLEYIVRYGWLQSGEAVWVQVLDRRQQITAIVTIPVQCFLSVAEHTGLDEKGETDLASRIKVIFEEQNEYWINVTDILHFFPEPLGELENVGDDAISFIVSSERTGFRHLYLATHSTAHGSQIYPITSGEFQIVDKAVTVDESRQLVYFTAKLDSVLETHLYVASYARNAQSDNVKRLTTLGYSHQVTLDVAKSRFLTLFSSMDQSPSCTMMHLRWAECKYSVRQDRSRINGNHNTWCPCGCQFPQVSSYVVIIREGIKNLSAKEVRERPVIPLKTGPIAPLAHGSNPTMVSHQSQTSTLGIKLNSPRRSISEFFASQLMPPSLLQRPIHLQESNISLTGGYRLPISGTSATSSSPTSTSHPSSSSTTFPSSSRFGSPVNAMHHPVGEFFTFMSSDNLLIHGCLYRPANYIPSEKYPTLVFIYGGPKSQMVTNDYKLPKLLRVFLATRLGHAVVMIDGRGSNERGIEFEGHLRHRMGQVEVRDQVEGLRYLARPENGGLVDLDRVAITGWSYGGYLSLMALVQYPDVFKIAIAGAPVTQWELYNSAYTERYMGLPNENKEGYQKSSVLHWVDKFPEGENRLLMAHGLIDENVHFKNSEILVADLIRFNKPHQIQIYPSERHGLRDARVNEHFETLMFFWLKNYL